MAGLSPDSLSGTMNPNTTDQPISVDNPVPNSAYSNSFDEVRKNLPTASPGRIDNFDSESMPNIFRSSSPSVSLGGNNEVLKQAHQTMLGTTMGKIFHSINGGHFEYSTNPDGTPKKDWVPEKPGEWAKNVVSAGLLGMKGIGPENGEHTFTQVL